MVKKTNGQQIDEFKSVDGQGELPEPTTNGSASRGADKSAGESTYSMSTKAGVLAAIMNDLQSRSGDEVLDVYKAISSTNSGVNKRSADKMNAGGETYGDTTHSPTAVQPVHAREDVGEIFAGEELSEEIMGRAATVYEAAVNARLSILEARMEEEYVDALNESIEKIHEEVTDAVDKYMSYVAKEWLESNQLAVDNGIKASMFESFIEGLKGLFAENHIEVSDESADVLSAMAEELEEIKARLSEEIEKNISLTEEVESFALENIVAEASEGLTASQRDKFLTLAENISFGDIEEFSSKIQDIKETYFSGKVVSTSAEPITESFDDENDVEVPSHMKAYAEAISRTVNR
jgi:hypothetical protein